MARISSPFFWNPQVTCTKKRAGLSSGRPSQTTRLNKEVDDLLDITWCGEFDQNKYLEARITSPFPRCVGGQKHTQKTPASKKKVLKWVCLVQPMNSTRQACFFPSFSLQKKSCEHVFLFFSVHREIPHQSKDPSLKLGELAAKSLLDGFFKCCWVLCWF